MYACMHTAPHLIGPDSVLLELHEGMCLHLFLSDEFGAEDGVSSSVVVVRSGRCSAQ
jgi:hypothetical protein